MSDARRGTRANRGHRLDGLRRVVVGRVELAGTLGGTLLVAGWHGEDPAAPGIDAYPNAVRVDAQVLELPAPPPELAPPVPGPGARAFLAAVPGGRDRPGGPVPGGPLLLGLDGVGLLLLPEHLDGALVDLPTLVEGTLGDADATLRAAAASFLAGLAPDQAGPDADAVAELLRATTSSLLVDRLPGAVISTGVPLGLCVDQLLALDERTFYLRGWARIGAGAGAGGGLGAQAQMRLTARSPEGARIALDDVLVRFPRPDVEAFYEAPRAVRESARSGFLACVRLPAPSRLTTGWVVELRDEAGAGCEAPAPDVVDDPELARATILGDLTTMGQLAGADRPGRRLMSALAHPALSALQHRRCGPQAVSDAVAEVIQHGTPPDAPEVTAVVPLYGRIDFLEHQLAAFAADPQFAGENVVGDLPRDRAAARLHPPARRVDLVYVLDSPELSGAARQLACELFRLHQVPFRLVLLRRNLGFAGATNAGAAQARGRLLLLLNSDVLPDRPGWLARLTDAHDEIDTTEPGGVGAVGPKLLYEDESIQHAGMWFDKPPGATTWANLHYFKGLHRHFPAADVARAVPGVTGACLLVDRALYEQVGGLGGGFVQGDFEDSDLCLRLRALDRRCWYLPQVELFHLEGQSYPDELRRTVAAYNGWLQTTTWDAELTAVMAEADVLPSLTRTC